MVFKYINPKVFLLAFFVGIIIVFVTAPRHDIVYKFPSPDNAGRFVYKDDTTGSCYKYFAKQVECDHTAMEQPINF